VLTDQMMPRLDGLGFLGELRRLPRYWSVPAILATALPAANLPAHGRGLYQAVLSKPFRDEALLALVAGLLPGDRSHPGSSGITAS
jgi:CheY-like chemotaxis protein